MSRHTLQQERQRQAVAEQVAWMVHCGASLAGYVNRYGSPATPDFTRWPEGFYGNGGGDLLLIRSGHWLTSGESFIAGRVDLPAECERRMMKMAQESTVER